MFQALGGLGLLLGTVGLGAVLLRNALERRRELALLRAVGYRQRHLSLMVLAENALLLALGLGTGVVCARRRDRAGGPGAWRDIPGCVAGRSAAGRGGGGPGGLPCRRNADAPRAVAGGVAVGVEGPTRPGAS